MRDTTPTCQKELKLKTRWGKRDSHGVVGWERVWEGAWKGMKFESIEKSPRINELRSLMCHSYIYIHIWL